MIRSQTQHFSCVLFRIFQVLTRSDQLALKHSNNETDGDEDGGADGMPKKRAPGRPKGKAKAKASSSKPETKASSSKSEPKAKAKAKAKAKGKMCKATLEASEAPEVAASPVLSEPGLEDVPETSPKPVRTRRGAFKKRHVRVGR